MSQASFNLFLNMVIRPLEQQGVSKQQIRQVSNNALRDIDRLLRLSAIYDKVLDDYREIEYDPSVSHAEKMIYFNQLRDMQDEIDNYPEELQMIENIMADQGTTINQLRSQVTDYFLGSIKGAMKNFNVDEGLYSDSDSDEKSDYSSESEPEPESAAGMRNGGIVSILKSGLPKIKSIIGNKFISKRVI
jgi:hypothetical protein